MFNTISNPSEKKVSITRIIYTLLRISVILLLILYLIALLPFMFRFKDVILEYSFRLVLVIIFLFLLTGLSYIFLRSQKRKIVGKLKLEKDIIKVNNNVFHINQIEKIRFIGNDIKGDFRGYISRGTKNEMIINFKEGLVFKTFFEQTQDNLLKSKKEILKHYRQLGILSESNLQNILNNTNYF